MIELNLRKTTQLLIKKKMESVNKHFKTLNSFQLFMHTFIFRRHIMGEGNHDLCCVFFCKCYQISTIAGFFKWRSCFWNCLIRFLISDVLSFGDVLSLTRSLFYILGGFGLEGPAIMTFDSDTATFSTIRGETKHGLTVLLVSK